MQIEATTGVLLSKTTRARCLGSTAAACRVFLFLLTAGSRVRNGDSSRKSWMIRSGCRGLYQIFACRVTDGTVLPADDGLKALMTDR